MTRRFAEKTRVPAMQSRMEVERLVSRYGCQQYGAAVDYLTLSARVQFMSHDRVVRFVVALPDPKKYKRDEAREQEERRVWRSLLLVIKAKLEAVQTGIATFEEEFLAHIVMPNGRTVADMIVPQIADSYRNGFSAAPLALGTGES